MPVQHHRAGACGDNPDAQGIRVTGESGSQPTRPRRACSCIVSFPEGTSGLGTAEQAGNPGDFQVAPSEIRLNPSKSE